MQSHQKQHCVNVYMYVNPQKWPKMEIKLLESLVFSYAKIIFFLIIVSLLFVALALSFLIQ